MYYYFYFSNLFIQKYIFIYFVCIYNIQKVEAFVYIKKVEIEKTVKKEESEAAANVEVAESVKKEVEAIREEVNESV